MLAAEVHLLPDKTVFIQLAIFLVVLVGLNHLVFKPLLRLIRLRREKTKGSQDTIQKLTEKTDVLLKAYEEKMVKARQEAFGLKESIRREGEAQGQKIIEEARQVAITQMEKAKKEIEKETDLATKKLEAEAKTLSHSLAEKLLGRVV